MSPTRLSIFLCLLIFALPGAAGASAAATPKEPFFPRAGNSGYDALEYQVRLRYMPRDGRVAAAVEITFAATEGRKRFSFDFFGPNVSEVLVDGEAAGFERRPGKLWVIPEVPVALGRHVAIIRYGGTPPKITDPDGSEEGWFRTDDGVIAVGEPQGTAAWIPCNNVPSDKARFEFEVTVPDDLKAIANGRQGRSINQGPGVTFRWIETAPMSAYLAVLNIGRGRIVKGRAAGIPTWTLVDPRLEQASRKPLAQLPEIIRFQARLFGGYPFESAGSIVDYAPQLGYALETQSRPIYTEVPVRTLIVHETAHQWFGDSVGLTRWPSIWLNEGFATWVEWYYSERHGGRGAAEIFGDLYRVPASKKGFWEPPSGRPGSARQLFSPSVYIRGAMALQALREKIGTRPMLRVLRRWAISNRHGSGTIKRFVGLAEEVSGQQLDPLFQRWLYRRGKP